MFPGLVVETESHITTKGRPREGSDTENLSIRSGLLYLLLTSSDVGAVLPLWG